MFRPSIALWDRRPKWLIIGSNIYDNWRQRYRFRHGKVSALQGATHRNWPVSKSLEYIECVFEEYLAFAGLRREELCGKRILELGPGDNLGVAIKFLAAGASHLTCLDRVLSIRDKRKEVAIYRAQLGTCTAPERRRIDTIMSLVDEASFDSEKLRYLYGIGIEEAGRNLEPSSFDLIISRAVLMEIHQLKEAFCAMDRLLAAGGAMVHQIAPCHDYGMLTQHGYHPLEYLTVPEWLYRLMTRDSGKPNRQLAGSYQNATEALGYTVQIHITNVVGEPAFTFPPNTFRLEKGKHYGDAAIARIAEIRARLLPAYRQASDEELMIGGMFLIARKP
jgi:hypothetical protein